MDLRDLCLNLLKVDSEKEVIELLSEAGFWNDLSAWRYFGDEEGNYSVAGAQQSKADAALVEKIINSVDARLMDEVLKQGIQPQSADAPQTIRYAVGKFIEELPDPASSHAGRIQFWDDAKRKRISEDIAVVATGATAKKGNPCFSVIDRGEGQTPENVPHTLMSLIKGNKAKIPFVQGKFNMGGTGVFRFCGRMNIQLVITKRDPAIVATGKNHEDDDCWSFTVVRRDNAAQGERSSVYRYLAPLGCSSAPNSGGVLRFRADSLPLFPENGKAHVLPSEWGTLIKLYEYHAQGFKSHILMGDGLLERLNLMLPDPALPVRLHECRKYKGHKGSFANTLTGLSVRLADDKKDNLEEGFPVSCPIRVSGEEIICTIYAFKKGRADSYKKNEGLIFTYNGQTHARVDKTFFKADRVRLGYLANSLLVMLDCSGLSRRAFEDLFMNSRDRLSDDAELTKQIKVEVATMLKNHEGLRELQNRRRQQEIADQLNESKPLEDVLEKIFKNSPALESLFLKGTRLTNVFKKQSVAAEEKPFEGKKHPTYFHFLGKAAGESISRECAINMRCRVQFQTDVENEYFSRPDQPGRFTLERVTDEGVSQVDTVVGPNLSNGFATLTFPLPEACSVGDICLYRASVTDETLVEPFVNEFTVKVLAAARKEKGKPGKPRKPSSKVQGEQVEVPAGISLPNSVWVTEGEWAQKEPPFDERTALRIVEASDDEEDSETYDFFINRDNVYLKAEQKGASPEMARLLEERFRIGLVLIGLALIHDKKNKGKSNELAGNGANGFDLDASVEATTRAIAPFLLPMISSLGALEDVLDEEAA